MNKKLLRCLDTIDEDIQQAVDDGRIFGSPFARYANDAAQIFQGIGVVMSLLAVDRLTHDVDDEGEDEGSEGDEATDGLSEFDRDVLQTFVRTAAGIMANRAGDLEMWARRHMNDPSPDAHRF